MSPAGFGTLAQPTLIIPPLIQAGIDNGTLFRSGSVVRRVAGGQIYKHLKEVPAEKMAQEAAKRTMKVAPKIVGAVVLATAAIGATVAFVIKKRKTADRPAVMGESNAATVECVRAFEASLGAYVDAAGQGRLDVETVDRLIVDLDHVKAWADEGNHVEFSFEQLEPLFSLVIQHTSALAQAYSVELTAVEGQGSEHDPGVVVQLREHLEMQRKILGGAA